MDMRTMMDIPARVMTADGANQKEREAQEQNKWADGHHGASVPLFWP